MKVIFEGTANGVRYYNIEGAVHITLVKMRGKYQKGDIFNAYTSSGGKYGCEYDGVSLKTSIEALEKEISIEE